VFDGDGAAADPFDELVSAFEAKADPSRADAMAAYMRHMFVFYGLPAPVRRKAATDFVAAHKTCSEDELLAAVDRLWAMEQREFTYTATDLLRTHWRRLSPGSLPRLRTLVQTNSWWDSVDPIAHVIGVLALNYEELRSEMDQWVHDGDRWIVRVALLHQLSWKDAAEPERIFGYCRERGADEDFFIRKAIGWALRDLAGSHRDEVELFLAEHGDELSKMSVDEATKHF
jgi:3-methyladenine DNA glycosylase AlkD